MGVFHLTRSPRSGVSSSRRGFLVALVALSAIVPLLFTLAMLHRQILLSIAVLTGSSSLAATFAIPSRTNQLPLRFTRSGTFQLSVLEDLHYGEAEDLDWGPAQDVASEKVINTILSAESPQLVVLNGDLITGENTLLSNSSAYLDAIVRPIAEHGMDWASVYGNHDSQINLSRDEIFAREKAYVGSRTLNMVPGKLAGVTNYWLPVFGSDEKDLTPKLILWFFDSRGGNYFQESDASGEAVSQPSWVDESVVDWFRTTRACLLTQYSKPIPSLAFVHIPIAAMLAFQNSGVSATQEPGINDDVPLDQQGIVDGKYTGADIPFMTALLETEGLMALFSGHDHGNDWCFKWDSKLPGMSLTGNGLHVCFGRHTGYGGYGTWTRGSRQILLREEGLEDTNSTETWIRLEDGTESGRVVLNDTFGTDMYPKVKNGNTQL